MLHCGRLFHHSVNDLSGYIDQCKYLCRYISWQICHLICLSLSIMSILITIYNVHVLTYLLTYVSLRPPFSTHFSRSCPGSAAHRLLGRLRAVANRCPSSFQWEALVLTLQRLASGCPSLWSLAKTGHH